MSKVTIALGFMLIAVVSGDNPVSWYREFEEVTPVSDDETVARNNQTAYRLPQNVVPLEYDIYIDLYFAERTDRPFSYDGKEYIIIQALEENVTQIVLHANVDSIIAVSLLTSGLPVTLNPIEPFTIVPQYHFLKINLQQALAIRTNYSLMIDYSSTMNEGPMKRGIWRGWYTDDNGNERIYATTHFQPYNARQAFPCWDEPLFKAVFKLHLSRPENYSGIFSNTRIESSDRINGSRVRDNFYATPTMSSYLITFLISESFVVIARDTSFEPPIRIIGRPNTVGLGKQALEFTVDITKYLEKYFGIPYSELHPYLNNDHVSSPDWASAGTENWGMVSYRELYMILDPRETIMSVEHYAATLIAHELTHKWFGNLITCYWWSNTWINEGFASYFGYAATYEVFPRYEHNDHFNSRYLQTSLSFDSSVSTVPMNHDVNTPAQVTGHFGTISYSKGASVVRMIVDLITPETFRKACRYFLRNNAYKATDQYDLYNAFAQATQEDGTLEEYSSFDFAEYYRVWVNEPGYPLLTVEINHATGQMSVSQERFFLSPSATPSGQLYPIPISFSTKSDPNFNNLKPLHMMSSQKATYGKTPREEWVIFNNLQHGHYRVTYDEKSWNLIGDALLNDPESIHYLNRAQIVDDVFALMRSERMTYDFGFKILRFLRNEADYHVWNPAISGYTWLRNRLRHIPESQAIFDSFILSYMEHAIDTLGFDVDEYESPTISLTRQEILHFACMLGHEKCVQESRERFIALRNNNSWVDPKIRRNVYVTGIREGGQVDFQFLRNRMLNSNFANDQLEMLRALGAARDPELLTQYLQLTLTKTVRPHDKVNSFNFALLGNQENAYTVLQFVKNNVNEMRVAYVEDAPNNPVHTCLSNLAAYLSEPGLVEYENWLRSTQSNSLQFNTAISAITSARNNMAWSTANAETILAAARDGAVHMMVSTVLLVTMAMLALFV